MTINFLEYALKIFLFIGVILYVPFSGTDPDKAIEFGYMVQDLFFRYGTIFLFCIAQTQTPIRTLKINSIPLLIMYLITSSLFIGFSLVSRASILNVFIWFVLYKTIYENFDFEKIKSYAVWFGFLLMINAAFCALQYNGHDFLFQSTSTIKPGLMDTVIGLLRVKVHLGVLAAILLPFVLVYAPIFSILTLLLFYFGVSSAAVFSAVISSISLAFMFLKKQTAFLIAGIIIVLGIIFVCFYDMPGGQFGERFKIWEGAASFVSHKNPILGIGIGSFKTINFATMQSNGEPIRWDWAHNEFIQGFFEMGIIGMAFVFSFLRARQKDFEDCYKDKILKVLYCSCFSILIISIFHFPFHLSRFSHLIAFFFATFHARLTELKNA